MMGELYDQQQAQAQSLQKLVRFFRTKKSSKGEIKETLKSKHFVGSIVPLIALALKNQSPLILDLPLASSPISSRVHQP